MFCYLVKVLADQKKYIITRRKHYIAQKPRFCVCVPQPDSWPPRFVMVGMPFADDITFKDLLIQDPTPAYERFDPNFLEFCNGIDVSGSNCKISTPLGPSMVLDFHANELINASSKKIFKKDFDSYKTDKDNFYNAGSTEFMNKLKRSWPAQPTN